MHLTAISFLNTTWSISLLLLIVVTPYGEAASSDDFVDTMSSEEMVQLGDDFYLGRRQGDRAGQPDN